MRDIILTTLFALLAIAAAVFGAYCLAHGAYTFGLLTFCGAVLLAVAADRAAGNTPVDAGDGQ